MADISKIRVSGVDYDVKDAEARKCVHRLSEDMANLQTSGLTTAQVNALDGLFKIGAYSEDASTAYAAFKTAFGLSDSEGGGDDSGGSEEGGSDTGGETETQTYTVTNNLTNVTNSNSDTTATGFYRATLSVADGYNINVTVTMGGVDVTADVYTEDGTILITNVTGDIVITAVAELVTLPVIYQLADTPKSVSGLSEDTGIAFGSYDANGYKTAMTICFAYTGFDIDESLMKMSAGNALGVNTNAAGSDTRIRITCCKNPVDVYPAKSENNDYRCVITKDKSSEKTIKVHYLSDGELATVTNNGTYGQFYNSVHAGNLLVGSSDIMVNDLTIYEGVMEDVAIAAYLRGEDI